MKNLRPIERNKTARNAEIRRKSMPQVIGDSPTDDGVIGIAHAQSKSGVHGILNGAFGAGVTGTSSIAHGVHGVNGNGANNPPLLGAGLWGETEFGYGVYGASIADNGIHGDSLNGDAVVGIAHAQGKAGVLGISESSNGGNGVSGISTSGNGVFGSGGQFAGFFDGNVRVTLSLTVDQDVVLGGGDCAEQFDVDPSDEGGTRNSDGDRPGQRSSSKPRGVRQERRGRGLGCR
jgi:hypothetical protein